jgi:hypothetical protein
VADGRYRIAIVAASPLASAGAEVAEAERLVESGRNVLLIRPAHGPTRSEAVNGVHRVEVRIPTSFDGKPAAPAKIARKAVLKGRSLRGKALSGTSGVWRPSDIASAIEPYLKAYSPDAVLFADGTAAKAVERLGSAASPLGSELASAPTKTVEPAPSLLIGANNNAGMGYAWARAAEKNLGIRARNIQKKPYAFAFGADIAADDKLWTDPIWQLGRLADTLDSVTHVLSESALAVHGRLNGGWLRGDLAELQRAGIEVGILFHGSDIRDPDLHAKLEKFSPFRDPAEGEDRSLTEALRKSTAEMREWLKDFEGPLFVSTPDLLDDVPRATWLPVVADLEQWTPGDRTPLEREVPVVVHAPSRPFLKGSDLIEPTLRDLESRGLIEYRRLEHIPHTEFTKVVQDADIVLDHFVIGNYGVVTCQAMAAGRVSIANISERVRERVPVEIPTIQADPDTLGAVIEGILDDRAKAQALASTGPDFVREYHDGRKAAEALRPFVTG